MSKALLALVFAGLAVGLQAAGPAPSPGKHAKKMRMDEPMTTHMMKPDMKKGDVKAAANKKFKVLQPMMEMEQKSMQADDAKR